MRISIKKNDPGHSPDVYYYKVYFNGYEIDDVITADEEQGYILRYVTDEQGDYIVNGGELKTEVRHGVVRCAFTRDGQP